MSQDQNSPPPPLAKPPRLQSLDAYRGLVMFAIASSGLGIAARAKSFPDNSIWQTMSFHFSHVEWIGCGFWDLIQPSFMFMVGVSMAYSYVNRKARGDSYVRMMGHAAVRSLVLVALAVFLSSNSSEQSNFVFTNVLAQIGLGYFFLFLLWGRGLVVQWLAVLGILIGYWALFAFWPLPPADFDYTTVGLNEDWNFLGGFAAHWNKNVNPAAEFDLWFLNLFPRVKPFEFNGGGYQTLNFVPSLATMVFGLMAGELLRGNRKPWMKFAVLIVAGAAGLGIGFGLHAAGVCPVVKRIWTPSWAVYSTGLTCLLLAGFYLAMDLLKNQIWATPLRWLGFPLVVVGMNSIVMYVMGQLLKPWTRGTLLTHLQNLSENYTHFLGDTYAPIVQSVAVMLAFWLFCFWLYRQKIFVRI